MEDRYLGDGVYASFDGAGIKLDLRAQAPTLPITEIYLEPAVLEALDQYRKEAYGPKCKRCKDTGQVQDPNWDCHDSLYDDDMIPCPECKNATD
jgi:hypothetical protein